MYRQFLSTVFTSTIFPIVSALIASYCKCLMFVLSWFSPNWLSWNNYSEGMLRTVEKKILQIVCTPYRSFFVDIGPTVGPTDKIWTLSFNTESKKTPIVLLHGVGAGVALWCMNIDPIAATRPLYIFDMLGFGRSSRPNFSKNCIEAENEMVKSIEEWRKEMNLDNFILLGHSLGGFLATSYCISYPNKVKHLILSDPWGFPEKPTDSPQVPFWIKTVGQVVQYFNPLVGLRMAGPLGPWFINFVRSDISKKYSDVLSDPSIISQYIYQCNSQHPSGESAFHSMMSSFGWAKNPMVRRINKLPIQIPVTLLYGSRSWLDHSATDIIKYKRSGSYFRLQIVTGAGHHIYADKPEAFNQIVIDACNYTDSTSDTSDGSN
ncbi:(Lyso)-N-acylphosphatidylethanolamine lipase-like [Cylas formicarius]|uniref:(Lyso)-N-acylphosphatidylethanolamine lipase-like n=1 Tax=Cylas formicarius TaxID=197179 RepID=UPI00295868A2|nr:(Lyso)-N-acylphosphatidylethanolamine lipase-like [Cylas formicarius]XP_060533189.1 (Lyso)-N-acylphosphatidylethanolamine lipase-like [Cylas formicarius]